MIFYAKLKIRFVMCLVILTGGVFLAVQSACADDESIETAPYLKYFPKEDKAGVQAFTKENRKLMAAWLELHEAQLELQKLRVVFGTRKRPQARRAIPRLEKMVDRDTQNFLRYLGPLKEEYEDERRKLKDDQLKIEGKMDWDRPETTAFKKQKKETEEIGEKIRFYEAKVGIVDKMSAMVKDGNESPLLAKFYGMDEKTLDKYKEDYGDVIEAVSVVKDYHADIAEVTELIKEQGAQADPRLARTLDNLESGMEKARASMTSTIEKRKGEFDREIGRAKRDLERVEKRISSLEKRGREPTDEKHEKAEIQEHLEKIEEVFTFLDKIAAGADPKEKKAAKTPKK